MKPETIERKHLLVHISQFNPDSSHVTVYITAKDGEKKERRYEDVSYESRQRISDLFNRAAAGKVAGMGTDADWMRSCIFLSIIRDKHYSR